MVQVAFDPTPAASLTWGFAYGSERVVPLEASGPVGRDLRGEREILAGLDLIALPALRDTVSDRLGRPVDVSVSGADVITLFDKVLPWLVERGVEMRLAEDAPQIREATEDPVITVRVDEVPESIDWYDLGVTVTIEDQEIAFADLFTALAEGVDRLLLPSGLWLRLDRPEFEQDLRALIAEARGLADVAGSGAGLRVNRYQSDWWQELAGLGVIERESATWAAAMAAMQGQSLPDRDWFQQGIHADLRPYQVDGFSWLGFLHDNAIGGILADDMGLGKTLQMLALFAEVRERSPEAQFLVVAPTSVVGDWRREAEQFAPGLDVATIAQTQGRRGCSVVEAVGDAAIVVTSYTLLRLEYEQYQELGWEILVLDEAQVVKNRHAKTYHCVRALEARSKFAITGTPLGELAHGSVVDAVHRRARPVSGPGEVRRGISQTHRVWSHPSCWRCSGDAWRHCCGGGPKSRCWPSCHPRRSKSWWSTSTRDIAPFTRRRSTGNARRCWALSATCTRTGSRFFGR